MTPVLRQLRESLAYAFLELCQVIVEYEHYDAGELCGWVDDYGTIDFCRRLANAAEDREEFHVHPDNIEEDARTVIDNLLSAAQALETAIEDQETDHDQPSE